MTANPRSSARTSSDPLSATVTEGDIPEEITPEMKRRYKALLDSSGPHFVIALAMLGAPAVLNQTPENLLDIHQWVSQGIPSVSLTNLASAIDLPSKTLSEALGISLRTLHRKKADQTDTLSVDQGGRAFKFASVVAQAIVTLGSRQAAVQWLTSPAIGLEQQKPIDLLATPMGTQLVEDLLDRIEYGVYT